MGYLLIWVGVAVVVIIGGYTLVVDDPLRRATFVSLVAFVLAASATLFFALYAIGEAVAAPGGWRAVWLTAAWVVPAAVLTLLAWFLPRTSIAILGVLVLGAMAMAVASTAATYEWLTFEDEWGPVRALVSLALLLPLTVLGMREPLWAGLMLVGLWLVPQIFAIAMVGGAVDAVLATALMILSTPGLYVGILLLVMVWFRHQAEQEVSAPEIVIRVPDLEVGAAERAPAEAGAGERVIRVPEAKPGTPGMPAAPPQPGGQKQQANADKRPGGR